MRCSSPATPTAACPAGCRAAAPSLKRPAPAVDRVPRHLGETAAGFRAVDPGNNPVPLSPTYSRQTNIPPTQSPFISDYIPPSHHSLTVKKHTSGLSLQSNLPQYCCIVRGGQDQNRNFLLFFLQQLGCIE